VVVGAETSGCGAKNRDGGALERGFVGEREGSGAALACSKDTGLEAEELSRRTDVRGVCWAEQTVRRLREVTEFSLMLNSCAP
jgi:hypothetical protein